MQELLTFFTVKLVQQWKVRAKDPSGFETNVHPWFARATLDAIGEGKYSDSKLRCSLILSSLAAFDYEFGSMDDRDNILGKTYRNLTSV